jgi:hypothetical protein
VTRPMSEARVETVKLLQANVALVTTEVQGLRGELREVARRVVDIDSRMDRTLSLLDTLKDVAIKLLAGEVSDQG